MVRNPDQGPQPYKPEEKDEETEDDSETSQGETNIRPPSWDRT